MCEGTWCGCARRGARRGGQHVVPETHRGLPSRPEQRTAVPKTCSKFPKEHRGAAADPLRLRMAAGAIGSFAGPVLVVLVMLVQPPPHHRAAACGGDDRVWRSGGTAESARRGKCWIDGRCASGEEGRRSSRDDDDGAYRCASRSPPSPHSPRSFCRTSLALAKQSSG